MINKLVRGVFATTLVLFSSSCVAPTRDGGEAENYQIVEVQHPDICRLYRLEYYRIPRLPDVSEAETDFEVIDILVSNIQQLRNDIREMKNYEC